MTYSWIWLMASCDSYWRFKSSEIFLYVPELMPMMTPTMTMTTARIPNVTTSSTSVKPLLFLISFFIAILNLSRIRIQGDRPVKASA